MPKKPARPDPSRRPGPRPGRPEPGPSQGPRPARPPSGPRPPRPGDDRPRGPRVTVTLRELLNFWGERWAWPVPRPVLQRAMERELGHPQSPLMQAARALAAKVGGGADVRALDVFHFQEGDFQLVFRVTAELVTGARVQVCLLMGKDEAQRSALARREHDNLSELHRRDPVHVIGPLSGGTLRVLDPGQPRPRDLYYYCTPWLTTFHEMGVNRRMHFYVNELPFHHFGAEDTEDIKEAILEVCFTLWDPQTRTAPEPPLIGAGDFVITRPTRGKPLRLRLIAARRLLPDIDLDAVMRLYLHYSGIWGGKTFRFLPKRRDRLERALRQSLVRGKGLPEADVMAALDRALSAPGLPRLR